MHSYIIAGIDPGATVGIAILDLSGRKLASESSAGGISEAVKIIERHGTPSLICCDVASAPEMAQKVASYFSCRLYSPQQNIREEDKREIARGTALSNNHERDAYAAAVFGFRAHANKLRQIDALSELGSGEKEKIKHLLLKGYRIKDAFAAIGEKAAAGEPTAERKTIVLPSSATPEELRTRIASLARENAHLRLLAERLEGEKRQLEGRVRLLENGVRQSFLRDSELRSLRYRLQQTLSRLSFRKKGGKGAHQQPQQKQQGALKVPAEREEEGGNLNMEEERLDLEKMVMDYRKGRHKGI